MKFVVVIAAVLLLFGIVVAVLAALAVRQPAEISVERSRLINAPPAAVFALVDDFARWPEWGPQDRADPALKRVNSGPAAGVGAVSDWTGSAASGSGRMTITKSVPDREVQVRVDFQRPCVACNWNEFQFVPEGAGTRVTWSMHGTNIWPMRVMSIFASPDRILGKHFETGLANLDQSARKLVR